jgi:hypothetical protein
LYGGSFIGTVIVTGLSLTLFMTLSGRVHAVRRRYIKVHGKPGAGNQHYQLDAAYADLNIPRSMPVLKYRWQRSDCCNCPQWYWKWVNRYAMSWLTLNRAWIFECVPQHAQYLHYDAISTKEFFLSRQKAPYIGALH